MNKQIIIFLSFFLIGCTTTIEPPTDFIYKEIKTDKFTLASWQKISNLQLPFKIYIEGDGNSFTASGRPTKNPTPKSVMFRKLAFSDKSANVIYLARPCQFVKDPQCEKLYWTTGRFAYPVISSTAQAIKYITNNEVVLIGFSGGAQVAGLVAVLNPEIKTKKIITIAGNLDHKSWATQKKLYPLKDSLSLTDYKEQLKNIPQLHYVGGKDKVIPYKITYDFIKNNDNIILLPNATHTSGWDNVVIE